MKCSSSDPVTENNGEAAKQTQKTLHTENANKMSQNNTVVEQTMFISH